MSGAHDPVHSPMNGFVNTTSQPSQPPNPTQPLLHPPHPLTTRYARQLLLPQLHGLAGQTRLSDARVLIIGLGGLGCPAALYLAAAGIGTLGFVDGDVVEESNLHRQVLHTEGRLGWRKVDSAREGVRDVNSACRVEVFGERVEGARGVLGILEGRTPADEGEGRHPVNGNGKDEGKVERRWDLVLDCTDNPATRYAISDAAVLAGVPVVSGAAQRGEGMLMVLNFPWREATSNDVAASDSEASTSPTTPKEGRGPCYRCIFPHPPDPSTVHSCSEIGVLGTAVGTIGVLMAQEAIKLLVKDECVTVLKPGEGDEAGKRGEMLIFNAFSPQGLKGMWRAVGLRGRREKCVSCGHGENKITREEIEEGRTDYEAFCGRVEDVRVLSRDKGERITAGAFLDELARQQQPQGSKKSCRRRIIDVREEIEVELGSTLDGAINVPFSKILRDPAGAFEGVQWSTGQEIDGRDANTQDEKVYFLCHRGNDSQIAAKKLMELDEQLGRRRAWVGDVEGGFVAMEKAQHNIRS